MNKAHTPALIFGAIVIAAVLGIYLPGLHNELLFDDARLTDGTIFSGYSQWLQFKQRWLSYGSFVWLQALWGEGWWKQRLVNIALHLGTVAALYGLVRDLLAQTRFPAEFEASGHLEASRQAALRVGVALFAVHPVAVYAVGYLVQRSILMATLLGVLACQCYVRALLTERRQWLVGAVLAYIAAVLAKEHAALMVVMAVPLYVFVRRPSAKAIAVSAGVSALMLCLAVGVLWQFYGHVLGKVFDSRSQDFIQQLEALSPGIGARIYPLSIVNEAWLFFQYGLLWLLPNVQWMSVDMRPAFPLSLGAFPQVLGVVGYLTLAGGAVWALLRGRGALSFAALCVLFPLVLFTTEFATVWVQDPFVLYRSYLWAIAIPGLVAVVLTGFAPRTIYTVGGIVLVLCSALALERNLSLRDGLSAWGDAAAKTDLQAPANAVGRWQAFLNVGGYHVDYGSVVEARKALSTAQSLGENKGYAAFNMGLSYQREKKHAEALQWFGRAQAEGFRNALVSYHLGESLFALGQFGPAYQNLSQALPPFAQAVAPATMVKYRSLRAEAAVAAQQYDVALADLQMLLANDPQSERLRLALGLAYVGKNDAAAALAVFNPLITQKPSGKAYYGRAMAHFKAGNKAASLQDLDQSIALEPNNPSYANTRAQIAADRLPR